MAAAHEFVVPAYGVSPYVEECLASLQAQSRSSRLTISTSTAFQGLESIAQRYGAELHVHSGEAGIGRDWNRALSSATADWVTLAHQDDVYAPDFAAQTMAAVARHPDALMVFTDCEHFTDLDARRVGSALNRVKRLLLELGFLSREAVRSRSAKAMTLRFGNPIPCPAVTLNLSRSQLRFDEAMRTNIDWAAWLDLCERDGSFVYVRAPLVRHRIHPGSETSETIGTGHRAREDEQLLVRLWPRWIARCIAQSYALAYASNAPR